MAGNPQVLGLLEEVLGSGKTPEEVCRDAGAPELLDEVRRRWQEFQLIDAQVRTLLPGLATRQGADTITPVPPSSDLPRVPGYEVEGVLGCGGMGVVYRATGSTLGREVAVKVLSDRFALDSCATRRFIDEARITAQLQHPGIPPVHDLGTLPDGRPFLAMKLIKGQTLDALLASRPEPSAERGRFVAVFEQLCQAVAYAHAHGVIHRDLKPANVMVGAFGEVQVMDWGLAKVLGAWLGERTDPEQKAATAVRIPRESDDPLTLAGSVLGTPAFMAPEQAAGAVATIDRRSDVFGLGAVLAVVLTGRPPFVADTQESTRLKAAQGDVGECFARLGASGADPDLVALCQRCLAPRPEDRPADAGEVAKAVAALRAAAEERARRAELERVEALARAAEQRRRRRLLLAASGIIALVLLAGLSVSLWQTRRARQALADEQKARQQAFAALESITSDLVERKFAQGAMLTEEDRAFLRGIIAQLEAFAAIKGDDIDSRVVRAAGRLRVGTMRYRLGELKEAERDYDQAVSLHKQLAADFPNQPEVRQRLASSHNNRGLLLRDTGRLPEAEKDLDQALSLQKQLAADFPSRPEFRRELAGSHSNRGVLLRGTGRLPQAEKDYGQAVSLQKQLAADFPSRPEFRQDLASSHNNRGVLLSNTGRLKEAERDFDQAVSIRKQLAADFPSRPEFRRELATSHSNRGLLLRQTGRLPQAEKDYGQAVSLQKQLSADFPSRPEYRQELAITHSNRGVLLRDTGRLPEAERDFDQALSFLKQLAADFPSRPEFRHRLASSHNNRGVLLRDTGRLPEAEQDYGQAVCFLKQLAADFPSRPEFRQELATSHNNRGVLLHEMGRLPQAEKDYGQALSLQKQLAADFPSRPEFRQELAGSHSNRGVLLRETGRLPQAEKDYGQALSIRQQLAADFPNQPDRRNELAGSCVNLALLHQEHGNWAAAKQLLLEGRPHHLAALKANPRHPTYRQGYRNHLAVLTAAHAGLLGQREAIRTAEACRNLGWSAPADAYAAACGLSLCVPAVAKHDKLDAKRREAAAQFYSDAAMKALREAVSKGYKDVRLIKKDTDLNPLRQREDFQKLVAELEAKGK
jgi:serine/threonine protein kinase/Flp pilus assembly protein TadD